jgi:hypothetical protein
VTFKKVYFLTIVLGLIKFLFAFITFSTNNLDFGSQIIGYDEISWQDSSLFFYENGLGFDAIKASFMQENAFMNGGWPYLIGIFHNIFGAAYINVIIVRIIIFFIAANSLYKLLLDKGHRNTAAVLSVLFLSFYHPFLAADATFLRDDIIVYMIILLLRLSSVKSSLGALIAVPLFLVFTYFLVLTRPAGFLVFISLYFFYFRLFKFRHLLFLIPPFIAISVAGQNIFSYSWNFLSTYQPDLGQIAFLSLKYYIGPFPWNMIGVDSGYNPVWYFLTLSIILLTFISKDFYFFLIKGWKTFLALFIVGLFPYIISNQNVDAVGPRQFAMVGPFLFIILYCELISEFLIRLFKVRTVPNLKQA